MGCHGGHLTQSWQTREAFLNKKPQKMSRNETSEEGLGDRCEENCRKREEHTERPGDKKEGKTRSGQAKELHLTGKRNGEGGRGARSSERR